ncbi:amino acid transporter, putative [Plasmodium gallinaceum]|uniref:Amino acid transporter, putative n=1 Tax=Plasmodium gallinaceum TaxID=5849 RepID=A0A1J1GWW2_PLAGA|nr:amino acid transporter, putative [Plasmodium gallinaceum]CRG96951.1 amino acid transporter, putative [Plasmodium gallinaceum]
MNIKWLFGISLFNFNKKNSKQKFVRSRKRFRTITWKYTKTIGPFASFIYLFNQSIGSGLFDIPSLIDEVGWIPVIFGNFFVCSVAVFCSLMILRAMTMIPKNKNFEQRIEYSAVIKYFMSNEKYRFVSFLYHLGNICNNICGILVISKIIDIFIIKIFGYTLLFQIYPEVKIKKCSLTLLDAIFNGYYYSSTGNYETIIISGFTIGYIINAIICIHLSSKGLEETINYQYIVFMIFMSSFLYLSISSTIYLLSQNYNDPSTPFNNLKIYNNLILNSLNHEQDLLKNYHRYNELNKLKKMLPLCKNPFSDECTILTEYEKLSFSKGYYWKDYFYKIKEIGDNIKVKKSDNNLKNSQTNKNNKIYFENLDICPFFHLNPLLKKKTYTFHNNIFFFILTRCSNDLKIKNISNNQYFYSVYKIYQRRNSLNSKIPKDKVKELHKNEDFKEKENKQFTNKFDNKYYQNKQKSLNEKKKYNFFKSLYYMISKIEGIKTYCMGKTFANFIDSYGFVSNIPSWGNEITDEVNVSKSIWISTLFSSIFYFIFGLIFCLNNSFKKINTSVLYIFNFVAVAPKVITGSISIRYDLMNLDICSDRSAFFFGCIAPFLFAWIFSNGIIFSNTFNYISLICGLFCNFLSPAFAYISACESNKYICKNPLRKYTIVNRKKTMFSSCTDIRRALGNIIDTFDDNDKNVQIEKNENNVTKEYHRKFSLDHYENKNGPLNYETNNDSYFKFVNGEYRLKSCSNDSNEVRTPLKRSSSDFKTIDNSNIFTYENKYHKIFDESKKETVINNMNHKKREGKKNEKMLIDELEECSEEKKLKMKKISTFFKEDTENIDKSKKEKKKKKVAFLNEPDVIIEDNIPMNKEEIYQFSENKNTFDQKEKLKTKKKLMFSEEIEIYSEDGSEQNKEKKKKGIIFCNEKKKDIEYINKKKNKIQEKEITFLDELKVNNDDNKKNKNIYTSPEDTKLVEQNKKIKKKKGVQFSDEVKIHDNDSYIQKNKKKVIFSNDIKVYNEYNDEKIEKTEKKVVISNEKKTYNEEDVKKDYEIIISSKDKKCDENVEKRKNFKFIHEIKNIPEKNYIKESANIFLNRDKNFIVENNLKNEEPIFKSTNRDNLDNGKFEILKEKKNILIESKSNSNIENIGMDINCNLFNKETNKKIKNKRKVDIRSEEDYIISNLDVRNTNDHTNINQKYFSEKIPKYQIKVSNNEFASKTSHAIHENTNFENKNKIFNNAKESKNKNNINNKDKVKFEKEEKVTFFKNKLNDLKKQNLNEKINSCGKYERNFSDSIVNYNDNNKKIENKEDELTTKIYSFEGHKQVFTRHREKLKSQYKCTISRLLENYEKYDNLMKDIESLKNKEQSIDIFFNTLKNQTLNDEKNSCNSIFNKNANNSNDKTLIFESLENDDNLQRDNTFCYANDNIIYNLQSIKSDDTYKATFLENCKNERVKMNFIPNKGNTSFILMKNDSENNNMIDKTLETEHLEDLVFENREALIESNKENLNNNKIVINMKGLTNENDINNFNILQKSISTYQDNIINNSETCYFDELPFKYNSIDKRRETLKIHPFINNDAENNVSFNNSKHYFQKDESNIKMYNLQVNESSELKKNASMNANVVTFKEKKDIKKDNILQLYDSNNEDYSTCKFLLPQNNSILKKETDILNVSNLIKENNNDDNTNNKCENNKLFVRQRKKLKSSFHANGDMIMGNSKEAIHKEQINEFRKKISNDSSIYSYYNSDKFPDILKQKGLQMKKEEITKEETNSYQIANDTNLEIPTVNITNSNEIPIKTQKGMVLKKIESSKTIEVPKHKTFYEFKDISKLYGEMYQNELETDKNNNKKDSDFSLNDKNVLNKNEDISRKSESNYIFESTDNKKNQSNKNINVVDKQNESSEELVSPKIEKSDVIKKIEKIYSELANKIHSGNSEDSSNEDDDDIDYVDVSSFKIIDNNSPVKYYYNVFHRSKILDTKKYEHFYSNNIVEKGNLDHLCSIFLFGNPLERNEEYTDKKDMSSNEELNNISNNSQNTKLNPQDKSDILKCEKLKTTLNSSMLGTNEFFKRSLSGSLENHNEVIKKSINERNSLQIIKETSLRKSNIKFKAKDEVIYSEELNDAIGDDSDVNSLKKNNSEKIEIMKIRIHVYPSILQKYHVETTYVLLGCLTIFSFVGIITDLLFS